MATPNSVRLDATTTADLERLASFTDRSKSWHIERAVKAYIADELAFIQAVEKGRADIAAGQGVAWGQARAMLNEILDGDEAH